MNGSLEKTVVEALDELESGESIEQIISRHPADAAALWPILKTAVQLPHLPPSPSSAARDASHRALLQRAQQLRAEAAQSPRSPWSMRFIFSFVSTLLVLFLAGTALVPLAGDAIPGDTLYPLKRGAESMRLLLAPESGEGQLRRQFAKERNREVYEMLEMGRNGQAGYTGEIVALGAGAWEIGHITVHITERTEIEGLPEVGARVEAHCLIKDGRVYAETLEVLPHPLEEAPAP